MPTNQVDVTEVVDRSPLSRFQFRIIAICTAIAVIDGFDTQTLGFAVPALAKDWGLAPASFTLAATLGLVGTIVGSIIAGAAGDRLGRRRVMLASIAIFSLGTLATAALSSMGPLVVLRFVTSLGIGGLLPNLIALVSEYTPRRRRLLCVTVVVTGIGVGGVLGGICAAWLVPLFNWHGLFIAGGVVGLLAGVVAFFGVPESIRFLTLSGREQAARALLSRLDASISAGSHLTLAEENTSRASVTALFQNHRATPTLLLWVIFAMNLLMLYFMLSWLPTLLGQAGFGASTALIGTSIYNLGGVVGGVLVGLSADRVRRPYVLLAATYCGAVLVIAAVPLLNSSVTGMFLAICAAGFCVVGAQSSLSALASAVYPTTVRATGVGWAFGVGRVGSILGPTLGGLFLSLGLSAVTIISLMAVPAAIAAAGALWLGLRRTSQPVEAASEPNIAAT
ncbi:MFS transporter [Amycolatopsis deserti]|uniref:MFS transporter n=1 Tax=Amycolatopsis deserti TaxID=185696 RepID=A0ABQ3IEL2_9PSEU|nr:MFS transporter [Amycolatopsis deserti]GHE80743.1 MFS transporter [Amycolatopsis deserti]